MSRPSVSVVLAVYNATWCIGRALDSVLAQTVAPAQIIVCDDGSTDGTPDLVEQRYGKAVTVRRLPHRNAAATRRVGLREATGEWLAFLDADDIWVPDKLERQLDHLAGHPEVRWTSSDGRYVSAEGVVRESWLSDYFQPVRLVVGDLMPALLHRCFPLMSSMLVEREAYHAVGGMDAGMVYSHDYDLWMRLAARYPGSIMPDRLIDYWSGPGTLSRRIEERYRDDLTLLRRAARGEIRRDPAIVRAARVRAAALAYELGLRCVRDGRLAEARPYLVEAAGAGAWPRRVVAFTAALAPDAVIRGILRSGRFKSAVAGVRARKPRLPMPESERP